MLSETSLQRLAYIRYLYGFAAEQSRTPEPFNSVALLLFHDSIEMFLQLSLEHLGASAKDPSFDSYFTLVDSKLAPAALTQREALRRMNKARVGLKHYGTLPAQLDMEAFRLATIAFFEENTERVFGIPLERISLGLLIENRQARESLSKAEMARSEGRLKDMLEALGVCFAQLLHAYRDNPHGQARRPFLRRLQRGEWPGSPESQSLVDALKESVEQLQDEVSMLRLGLDPARLSAFRRLVPIAAVAASGFVATYHFPNAPEPSLDELQFCYNFVIESALRLQRLDVIPPPRRRNA